MPQNSPEKKAVESAEKAVAGVLDDLEDATGSEVKKIALEDVVDVNERTGRPEVRKAVDIQVQSRPERKWSR
ncbi:hypothetical protein [Paracidovorax wautersii]|uniref:Dodecin domain-containing protein n=1 Tax=Paracidovorax wautersii TaxID=1177982 RepID=A0ABU1IEE4_9BURK|nr:hypothetical protein [Paracidovorax wautersii]MDR6215575.1 hypothetical protein [Paracidovorax wautersii]